MKPSIIRLRALEKQLFAYRYALNTVDFDAETVAPEGSADGRAEACEVLSRASFERLVNADTAALLQQAAAEAETEQEQAEVRQLQRHETGERTTEFKAFDYISAARSHFGMNRDEASQLTMTEFQMLLAAKYPDQKGFTREEYDSIADEYLAKQAARRAKAKQ